MKTLNLKNVMPLVLGAVLAVLVACDKKGNDSNPAPAAPAPVYNFVNGNCVDTTTNQPVAANLCGGAVINGSYRWNGTTCTNLNGQPVAQSFCTPSVSGAYRWTGTQCLDVNNSPVAQTFCANVGGSNTNYRWNGIACIDMNGQAVAPDLCRTAGGMTQYQLVGGECYSGYNWVPYSFCANQTGYVAGQCNGTYIKYSSTWYGSYYITKYCSGTSCSGETLLEYSTRRPVVCP